MGQGSVGLCEYFSSYSWTISAAGISGCVYLEKATGILREEGDMLTSILMSSWEPRGFSFPLLVL